MPNLGMPELIVILVVVLLLFGAKRLPEIGKSLGRAISSFKDGMKGGGKDDGDDKPSSGDPK